MKRQNKVKGLQRRKAISGYLFISPFIIGFLAFMIKPLAQSFYMSLCRVDISVNGFGFTPMNTLAPNFNLFQNYVQAFTIDVDFNRKLVEEITRMSYNALAIIVFSFFTALILNQKFKGRALVRAIFFLPVILSSGVIVNVETSNTLLASVANNIEGSLEGTSITQVIQDVLVTSGMGSRIFETIFEIVDGVYDVAIASGIQIIIFLSGLQTISQSMYEAADIEGCTKWESLWKITFPMISPLLLVNWIYTVVDFCMRSDNEIMKKISDTMMVNMNYGFASAMAWSYFAIVIVIIGVTSLLISKGVYYYE